MFGAMVSQYHLLKLRRWRRRLPGNLLEYGARRPSTVTKSNRQRRPAHSPSANTKIAFELLGCSSGVMRFSIGVWSAFPVHTAMYCLPFAV